MKLLLKHKSVLQKWGFQFEGEGGGYLSHVPYMAREMDPFQLDLGIQEYLEILENGGSDRAVPPLLQQQISSLACRNAIKFGDELTLEECHSMVEKLLKTKLPFQCAHGRPSMIPLALI
ncbi:DNA mismatch repair protein [Yarrowia sp. E02]|nr:DNA mismatch repair protein [Yarrowia sp. E02]